MKRVLTFLLCCAVQMTAQQLSVTLHEPIISSLTTTTIAANTATSTSAAGWSSTPDYRVNVPEPTNSGDTLVAGVCYNGTPTLTVTDSAGDTATQLIASSVSANSNQCRIFSFTASAGVNWVNFNFSSTSVGFVQPYVANFFNTGLADGAGACNAATSATVTSGSLGTLAVSGDLIVQIVYSDTHASETSFTAGSQSNISWKLANALFGDGAALQYGIYNSTAALNPQFTQAVSHAFISCAVALKAASSGSPLSTNPIIRTETDDAMPKVAANPWSIGAVVSTNVVYFAYLGNDPITSVTSSPVPDVTNWTASGADFAGTNGHNHVNVYCAKFSSPPGLINISLTRSANTNDSINKVYSVAGGTCNLDVDSAGQAGTSSAVTSTLQVCTNCATPTHTNDFVIQIGGEFWCTTITFTGGFYSQTNWFSGNTVDGPTQTDENNSFTTFKNGASLSAFNVTWNDVCTGSGGGGTIQQWASRVVAYQSTP